MTETSSLGERLLLSLQSSGHNVRLIETHISWVLVTEQFAYKIKKPLDLGFLDFSTLAAREHFCQEEVRLNRRLLPNHYLGVVPVAGSSEAPELEGKGEPIDWAVKMTSFAPEDLASEALGDGRIGQQEIEELAKLMAGFHKKAAVAGPDDPYGESERLFEPMKNNFATIGPLIAGTPYVQRLEALESFSRQEFARLKDRLVERKEQGRIKELHGDLHLGNMVLIDGALFPFDAIEFNPFLRWIDVMSETAFLIMDLADRGRSDLAGVYLNHYLAQTGDYEGVPFLRHFMTYRALVRAKVSLIRAGQEGAASHEKEKAEELFSEYLSLAESFSFSAPSPTLIILSGVSGAGKSHIARLITGVTGAITIRSDVERKRIFGLRRDEESRGKINIYTSEANKLTFQRLLTVAESLLEGGQSVVVDATNLRQKARKPFLDLADNMKAKTTLVFVSAPLDLVKARIAEREEANDDPSEASVQVMEDQLGLVEPPSDEEQKRSLFIDSSDDYSISEGLEQIRRFAQHIEP